jgi:hypothetical protein
VDFSSQTLATAAHNNVGKVTIPNVTVDCSFTNVQLLCCFLYGEQPLVIIRSNQIHFVP